MKKIVKGLLGIVFIILGIIGLALPIIPQIPFLVLGLLFLTSTSDRLKEKIESNTIYQKYVKEHIDKFKSKSETE